jgi:hypothetical protein
LGTPVAYVDKVTDQLKLLLIKAELPCDILLLQGIRKVELDSEYNITEGTALRSATDIYHTSPTDSPSENTSITKGIIFISEPKVIYRFLIKELLQMMKVIQ